ncbi:MAG: hypothetical protein GY797_39570 [Deltaproteobacteria bacterium]|nr:hypothetical protein [Deltaproteobacteria bacterium]
MNILIRIAIFILIAYVISIPVEAKRKKRLNKYWSRSCMGKQWKKRFPTAVNEDIRSRLEDFVDCFAFKRNKKLKFEPDDKVMDIYHTVYLEDKLHLGDMLELESFAVDLEKKYGIDLEL